MADLLNPCFTKGLTTSVCKSDKMHYKNSGQLWRHWGTLGTKLEMPIFTLYLPHNKVGFWYFRSLYIRNTISNKTYQNFRDKRLLGPGSKYPIWQRSQLISYNAKFSQRDNVYLADFKYNITYQNIRGKTKVRLHFIR